MEQPLNRVNVTFLELEIQSLRNKLKLYQEATSKGKTQLEYVKHFASTQDPQQEHFISTLNQKHQIFLQLEGNLEEADATEKDLVDNFKKFKVTSHQDSIRECGDIIFEMRRLRAKYNTYTDFKKNQETFKQNFATLEKRVTDKTADVAERVRITNEHIQEQKRLIVRSIHRSLTNEAFTIGWKNLGATTRNFIWAKINNIGLKTYIQSTSEQNQWKNEANLPFRKTEEKVDYAAVRNMIKTIQELRNEIDLTTSEIAQIKLENRKRLHHVPDVSPSCSSDWVFQEMPQPENFLAELESEKMILEETKNRYNDMRKHYHKMQLAKTEILKLATMIANFRKTKAKVFPSAQERLFQRTELKNFIDNVIEISEIAVSQFFGDVEAEVVSEELASEAEPCSQSSVLTSRMTLDTDQLLIPKSKLLSVPSHVTLSMISSQCPSLVFDVEQDFEELNYIYEIERHEEEEADDKLSSNEVTMLDSDDML